MWQNGQLSHNSRGTLNSIIIFWKRHNILERYDFGTTRKHIEVGFNLSLAEGQKMLLCFHVFFVSWSLPVFFLLARFGRKTDQHIKHMYVF